MPTDFAPLVGSAIARALEERGFQDLMPVQEAVLDPALAGRDLRVSSQTGSGKTVALGLTLRDLVQGEPPAGGRPVHGVARPRGLVVVPTRELGRQVHEELSWLYAHAGAKVASATGGSDAREERRAFAQGPAVIVGTPGRLLDHLQRGSIDGSQLGAVILDEADHMLDLGFREDLEAILAHAPEGHLTHLVSATFPREVLALADRVQREPARIEGTPLGTANADIDHVIHLVDHSDRLGAIVNLLLSTPGAQTLIFVRTRADVGDLTQALVEGGFQARGLSGEMEQRERNQALASFKGGTLDALVATDVAARGIDVQDIARVIHADPPTDSATYTHRSGRTGRAGKKGISALLVSPAGVARTSGLLRRAGVSFRFDALPTAASLRRGQDERLFAELTAQDTSSLDPRVVALAERLAAADDVASVVARLLQRARVAGPEPRDVRPIAAPADRPAPPARVRREHDDAPRAPRAPRGDTAWVAFRFTWGSMHGADPRRLLAMACRRGGVRAGDVGAIAVERMHSVVEIARDVAEGFARATEGKDPRDPRVMIRPELSARSAPPAPPAPHAPNTGGDARRGGPRWERGPRSVVVTAPPPRPRAGAGGGGLAPRKRGGHGGEVVHERPVR